MPQEENRVQRPYRVLVAAITGQLSRYPSFWDSLLHLAGPPGTQVIVAKSGSCYVEENREAASAVALEQPFTHILYLDDDQVLAPQTLTRLLRHELPIVAGHYLKREQPFASVAYDKELENGSVAPLFLSSFKHGLEKVKAVGAGCLLVKTEVLKTLERPWWRRTHLGEDVVFCQAARAAGYDIFVDLDTPVGHSIGPNMVLWPQYQQDGPDAGAWRTVLMSNKPGEPPIAEWPQITPEEVGELQRVITAKVESGNGVMRGPVLVP